jgi:hypothetical protein
MHVVLTEDQQNHICTVKDCYVRAAYKLFADLLTHSEATNVQWPLSKNFDSRHLSTPCPKSNTFRSLIGNLALNSRFKHIHCPQHPFSTLQSNPALNLNNLSLPLSILGLHTSRSRLLRRALTQQILTLPCIAVRNGVLIEVVLAAEEAVAFILSRRLAVDLRRGRAVGEGSLAVGAVAGRREAREEREEGRQDGGQAAEEGEGVEKPDPR